MPVQIALKSLGEDLDLAGRRAERRPVFNVIFLKCHFWFMMFINIIRVFFKGFKIRQFAFNEGWQFS